MENTQEYHPEDLTEHEIENLSEMEFRKKLFKRLDSIDGKVNPMYEMFSSVSGFNKISMWILKFLAVVGGAIAGFYMLIEFLKKVGKT